jgi:hypothetical protein
VCASRAERDSSACKPGSVGACTYCRHRTVISLGMRSPAPSSGLPAASLIAEDCCSPLIRPCSNWGLPCRPCCHERGGLLPHHFTLTHARARAVYFLWRCPSPDHVRRPGVTWQSVHGARTFLEAEMVLLHRDRPAKESHLKVARIGRENSRLWLKSLGPIWRESDSVARSSREIVTKS